jgi:hypothetical protein
LAACGAHTASIRSAAARAADAEATAAEAEPVDATAGVAKVGSPEALATGRPLPWLRIVGGGAAAGAGGGASGAGVGGGGAAGCRLEGVAGVNGHFKAGMMFCSMNFDVVSSHHCWLGTLPCAAALDAKCSPHLAP